MKKGRKFQIQGSSEESMDDAFYIDRAFLQHQVLQYNHQFLYWSQQ